MQRHIATLGVLVLTLLLAHNAKADDMQADTVSTVTALSDISPASQLPSAMVGSGDDLHTQEFRNRFNELPPAVKLSLLMQAFREAAYQQ